MGKKVIIAEKPSVAREFAKVLKINGKNNNGYYSIINGKKPEECLWIDDSINVINNYNYDFKKITITPQEPIKEDTRTLIFTCKKKGLYGIYLDLGDKLYIDKTN